MTTNKRYKTYEYIRKMPNYIAVREELETFFGGLAADQVGWFREVFSEVIGARILSEGYVDCSLYVRYEQPKLVNTKLLKQMGSAVHELYRMRKTGEDNSLAVVFADFWKEWETARKPLGAKESEAVLYWFFTRYSAKMADRQVLLLVLAEFLCVEETDIEWGYMASVLYNKKICSLILIESLQDYVEKIADYQSLYKKSKFYYRGHASLNFDLLPSIRRLESWHKNEDCMYHELLVRCPNDFRDCKSHLDYLVEMQHYGLPTRLLDITENPMVALYFACDNKGIRAGEVILFPTVPGEVKYFHSDTVAVLAALSTRSWAYKEELRSCIKKGNVLRLSELLEQLAREIKSKNPAFEPKIRQQDIQRNLFVSPVKSNQRIVKQEGAFIICGLYMDDGEENSLRGLRLKDEDGKMVVCVIQNKDAILQQLDQFGINQATLFPEIDLVTGYIKGRYAKEDGE